MTFEKFEQAKETYAAWDYMASLACSFNKGEFNDSRELKIALYNKPNDEKPCNTVVLTDEIRQKINELLWEEANRLQKEFEAI